MSSSLKENVFPKCPIRNVLARICDKWSLLIIYSLQDCESARFSVLRRKIPDVSQKMLTSTLKTLEADGYVSRRVYAEVPPRVEYSLTARSRSLLPIVESLVGWAESNMAAIIRDRESS